MKIAYRESGNLLTQGQSVSSYLRFKALRHTLFPQGDVTITAEMRKKRLGRLESFKLYTEKILPKMEETIEIGLLREIYNKIPDKIVKSELLNAYKRRRISIAEFEKPFEPQKNVPDIVANPLQEPMRIYLDDMFIANEFEIGKFMKFTNQEMNKVFTYGPMGRFEENQFKYNQRFYLQMTEEAFFLTDRMRKLNYKRLTENDYKVIFAEVKSQKDAEEILNDEDLYTRIFHDFAITLLDRLAQYRKDEFFDRIFTDCFFFDILVNILVRELNQAKFRPHLLNFSKRENIMDSLLKQLKERLVPEHTSAQTIVANLTQLKTLNFIIINDETKKEEEYQIKLKGYTVSPRRLPSSMKYSTSSENFIGFNSGALLHGDSGVGKTGTLMYTTMWAHKNDWIVVVPPSGYDLTQNPKPIKRHPESGLYLHLELAADFLKNFKMTNEHLIKDIPVNLKYYGKYNSAGVHENEPHPTPVYYIAERKIYSNDWEQFITEEEKLSEKEEKREFEFNLKYFLPEPKKLTEIIDTGLKHPRLTINALYEILEQLYNLDSHRVLIAIDDFNWFFRATAYPSFRYSSIKGLEGTIPSYHMSFCRAFMKFDGHKIKNGFKIATSGSSTLYKHKFTPNHINFPKGYSLKMGGLKYDDFRYMCEHLIQTKLWKGSNRGEDYYQELFVLSQGNWGEALRCIRYPLVGYE